MCIFIAKSIIQKTTKSLHHTTLVSMIYMHLYTPALSPKTYHNMLTSLCTGRDQRRGSGMADLVVAETPSDWPGTCGPAPPLHYCRLLMAPFVYLYCTIGILSLPFCSLPVVTLFSLQLFYLFIVLGSHSNNQKST